MATVGSGTYTYEPVENWAKLPPGWSFKEIGGVGVDRRDNVFVFKATGASFGVETIVAPVRDRSELESVVAAQAREPNGGLIVMPDSFTDAHRVEITSLAARYRLPAVYFHHSFAVLGGLLSYGVDLTDNFRRAATYADRILKGAKPTELPEIRDAL